MIVAPKAHKTTVNEETQKTRDANNEYHVVHKISRTVVTSRMKIRRTFIATATIASGSLTLLIDAVAYCGPVRSDGLIGGLSSIAHLPQ